MTSTLSTFIAELRRRRVFRVAAFYGGIAYLGLEEFDRALDWLEQGCTERAHPMPLIAVEPVFDPIRAEPRFQALLKKMGLDERHPLPPSPLSSPPS